MVRRDDAEFLDFADAYRPQMRRTAYLMCQDWERAADITQEALIRLYVAWPRLDKNAGLRTYARRTVVNVSLDIGRKRSSRERPEASPADLAGEDPSGGVVERMFVIEALSKLPPRQRACVVLRYYEDLSVEDVAEVLGCRAGTVKSQTARGLTSLRALFEGQNEELIVDTEASTQPSTEARTW